MRLSAWHSFLLNLLHVLQVYRYDLALVGQGAEMQFAPTFGVLLRLWPGCLAPIRFSEEPACRLAVSTYDLTIAKFGVQLVVPLLVVVG
jgi:hypothetical protein